MGILTRLYKELVAVKFDTSPLFLDAGSITVESLESLSFSFIDGSTYAYAGKIFSLSRIQILIQNQFENINNNNYNIKYPADECFESSFSSIRARMAKIGSIEVLELLYTRIIIFDTDVRAFILVFEVNASDPHAWVLHAVPHVVPRAVPHVVPRAVPRAAPHVYHNANSLANFFCGVEHANVNCVLSLVSFVSPIVSPCVSPCLCSILAMMLVIILWINFWKINKKYFDIIKSTHRHKLNNKVI